MYRDYVDRLTATHRKEQTRWNGKVITTDKQWQYNDHGSATVQTGSFSQIYGAIQEARDNDRYY